MRMHKFVERALKKLSKLDEQQIRSLLHDLAAENERLEVVLDSMNDGVLVCDNENRLLLTNKAADRLLPMWRNESGGDVLMWDVIKDEDIAAFVRETLESDESVVDREFTLNHGTNDRILSLSIVPLVQAGRIEGNLLRVEDISEKRAREARLRRAESLASLTTLAAGVAHEIKNPLGSIGIHLQLVNKALSGQSHVEPDSINGYLEVIGEEVERLNRIVVDFLFAVRPMDVHPVDTSLNRLIGEMVDFVQHELEQEHINLSLYLDDSLPELKIDEKYFKQALLNLIKNAIAAMPDGGELSISTEVQGDDALMKISDTGFGMSDDVINKIFEPYFTTRDSGSGIGLTIVYKIVREHAGEITVNSEEGRGSTFTISLPIPQREMHLIGWEGDSQ